MKQFIVSFLRPTFSLRTMLFVAFLVQAGSLLLFVKRFGLGGEGFLIGAGDPDKYLEMGLNLLKHKAFFRVIGPFTILESYIPPLYPIYIAVVLKIFGQVSAIVIAQQLFFVLPTTVVIWKIFENVFDKRVAFFGTLLVTLDTQRLILVNQFSAESLFLLLFFLFILFIIKFTRQVEVGSFSRQAYRHLIFAGLFLGLATLTRTFVFALTGVISLYLVFLYWRKYIVWRQLIKSVLVFVSIVILTISPWIARNYYHFKTLKLSTAFEYNFYNRHLKRIYEYQLKKQGADVNNLDQLTWIIRLNDFRKDNHLENASEAEVAALMWDARYADYELKKTVGVISENLMTYLWVWVHRVPGWLLDNNLGILTAFVDTHFYPIINTWKIQPYQALWFGRFVFLGLYLTILSGFIFRRNEFSRRINSFVFFFLLAGTFVSLAAMVYTPRHKMPIDFITYGCFVFAISSYLRKDKDSTAIDQPKARSEEMA